MMMAFTYSLGDRVEIYCSGEAGEVIACAMYQTKKVPCYLIRYQAADGRAVEAWWDEDALTDGLEEDA